MKNIVYSNVRVEEESWDKLREIAKTNKRSINKEIEYLIDKCILEFEKENGKIKTSKEDEKMPAK